jgi:hypothetical protein
MLGLLGAVGLAVLGLVGYIIVDVLGQAAADEAFDAVSRRPSFAERRKHHRGLMKGGIASILLAAMSGWIWLAAATSGHSEDADDARVLGFVTGALTLPGCALLAAWWRRSGAPKH